MKCLRKYQWVKLPRDIPDMGKGLMAYWAMLAFRAAFRKGNASYCGHSNPVAPGMWAGGVVGLKSILGVRSRTKALQILGELSSLGFLKYSLDSQTKKLTYEITDWVVKCSGAECMSGTVYASTGYGFLCLPRNITQRLANAKRVFDEADAWLDLWCHTTYEDYGNAFSFLAPVVQYGRFGSVLTLETLGERWGWEKTKVWRFFKKHGDVFSLYRLPSSYGCLVFNASYPTGADIQLANHNEDLFYMSVFVTISAKTYDELLWRKQQMTDMLKSMDMYLSDCRFQQEDALRSVMPFLQISPKLQKKTQRNVLTSGAASTYMFTSFEMSDDSGVLLGVNRHNNSLCIVDLFNTKINKNANLTMCGTSGTGKTFTLQLLALRMRMRGIQCYIIAPIKGHEFKRACSKIGGEFIKIAPGSPHCINVMEIRHTISPEMELIDEVDYNDMDSMLARKIQQLMIFFSLLIPDMTNEEEQMLDEALIKTYNEFGITHDNNSLYADATCFPPKLKKMPILGDLHKHLLENPMTTRIAAIVSRFVTGSAQSFNRQTNVDLTNKYIVLDLSELKGKLLPVGMMIALDYVWDNIKADRVKKKAIMIDEIWQLIGASSNKLAAEFCLEIFKVIRGYGGAAIAATQDLSDFFSLDDGKYGRAIINNSKNKIILNLEQDEAQYVKDVLKLTRTEVRSITQFERGEALIHSNNNKVPVVIKASVEEKEMITTDRAELEAILRKRQKEAT